MLGSESDILPEDRFEDVRRLVFWVAEVRVHISRNVLDDDVRLLFRRQLVQSNQQHAKDEQQAYTLHLHGFS